MGLRWGELHCSEATKDAANGVCLFSVFSAYLSLLCEAGQSASRSSASASRRRPYHQSVPSDRLFYCRDILHVREATAEGAAMVHPFLSFQHSVSLFPFGVITPDTPSDPIETQKNIGWSE